MRVSPQRTDIATARLGSGMRQKEFAEKCGVSVSYLQKVELGKLPASKRLAEAARKL
jgi:transcriptional regulator with XRE-family HTH domain